MANDDEDNFIETGLDAPVVLEIQIGFHPEYNKATEARYKQIQQELMDYVREKYKDILVGVETVFYEMEEELAQDQEIVNSIDKTLH